MTKRRPFLGVFAATALIMGMAVASVAPQAAAADPVQTTPNGAPASIPGLSNWEAGTGSFQFTASTQVVAGAGAEDEAAKIATDLSTALDADVTVVTGAAGAGDVAMTLNDAETELGEEGYRIEVGETIEVTAATEAGLFYGGQTAVQWAVLAGTTSTIPAGSSVDIPAYPIRSVGICACIVNISIEKFEQVIKEMAYYKMNELWIELKVESEAYPAATFWSYYTNEQAEHLSEFAANHNVSIVAEVNSPGHMGPWLQNLPELQLVNAAGVRQPTQLDISKPEALEVVKKLATEYIAKFDLDWYHMGADEYLLGSGSFENFPQIIAEARKRWGEDATENDLFIDFINQVNAHVKAEGANLRIFQDGIPAAPTLQQLDKDIVVEAWNNAGRSFENTLAAGHDVVNLDNRFYFTRNNNWGNLVDRWNENWTPHRYLGRNISDAATPGKILGGKMVLWPDNGPGKTENQLFSEIHETLRFLAQATWSEARPAASFADFTQLGQKLGNGPNTLATDYSPLLPGDYAIRAGSESLTLADGDIAMTNTESTWNFTTTSDGYYKIAQGDQCLAMEQGDELNIKAPNEFGQEPVVTTCTSTPREAGNLQKWWIRQVEGGFTISHAISNMPLVVDGAAVAQQDPNKEPGTVFALVGDGVATTAGSFGRVLAGVTVQVPVTVRNLEDAAVTNVVVTPVVPEGWTVDIEAAQVGNLAAQTSRDLTFRVTPDAGPAGAKVLEFVTSWVDGDDETQERTTSVPLTFSCAANTTSPSEVVRVSSEQNDQTESSPAVNVIDGNPNTFWHTQYNGAEPAHPHQLVVGLPEAADICAVTVTPRQGVSSGAVNGQIKGYELYATADRAVAMNTTGTPASVPAGWTKVAEGELPGGQSEQWIPFTQSVNAQYLLLISKSAQDATHPWTTLGEFSVDVAGADTPAPEDPTLINQSEISIHDVSSAQTAGEYPAPASQAIDGDSTTIWHQDWSIVEGPHHISFDLGDTYEVDSLIYTPRQQASRNGVLREYEVYVTDDPANWGTPAAADTLADSLDDKTIALNGATGQYVRLVFITTYNDDPAQTNATAAEVNFAGVKVTAPSPTPSASPSVTPSASPSVTPSASPSVTPSASPSVTPSATPSATPSETPSVTPSTPDDDTFVPAAPYTLPGTHTINDRQWFTECEDYSQTERCRTEIWATVVKVVDGQFVRESGWAFNNLTYLPYMTREAWQGNPLGSAGEFESAGRQWKTDCDTAATGRGACRSYTMTTVYAATAKPEGGYTFSQSNDWVFNNIVMFGGAEKR